MISFLFFLGLVLDKGTCTDIFKSKGLACNILLMLNKTEIEEKAGISCTSSTEHTQAYHPTVKEESGSSYKCFGIENIEPKTNCDAEAPNDEKRVCDCVAEGE